MKNGFGFESLSASDDRKCRQLWKLHLKTPGVLPPSTLRLLKKKYVSQLDITFLRLAWAERFGTGEAA